MFDNPLRQFMELGVRVVVSRDQQRRGLEPGIGLVADVFQRLEHGL